MDNHCSFVWNEHHFSFYARFKGFNTSDYTHFPLIPCHLHTHMWTNAEPSSLLQRSDRVARRPWTSLRYNLLSKSVSNLFRHNQTYTVECQPSNKLRMQYMYGVSKYCTQKKWNNAACVIWMVDRLFSIYIKLGPWVMSVLTSENEVALLLVVPKLFSFSHSKKELVQSRHS